jgi:hypothetical protein
VKLAKFTKKTTHLPPSITEQVQRTTQCTMIYEQNTDGINVFPILHRHVPPRFNAFLPTERHQSLATAKLIVDTDTISSQPP